jgi:hypothetical protein
MRSVILALGLSALCTLPAHAATIAAVLDESGATSRSIGAGEAAAISFSLSEAISALTVSAPIDCFSCRGEVFLTNDIGAGASLSNLVGRFSFDAFTGSPLFSGLTLPAGAYYLGAAVTDGFATWRESLAPTVIREAPGNVGLQYAASPIEEAFPASSDFLAQLSGPALLFEVEIAAVPAPASLLLLVTAAGGLLTVARRRRADV